MPDCLLGIGVVPSAPTPILLPSTATFWTCEANRKTPSWELPEITLPAGPGPPMVTADAAKTVMPVLPLPRAVSPVASVPM